MPLDPFLVPIVASLPPFPDTIMDWAAFRAQERANVNTLAAQFVEPGPEIRSKTTVTIPVSQGEIDLDIYTPDTEGPHPIHLYLHGGGWVGGSIHTDAMDAVGRERAAGADCVVVAVDYRKAPEHQFPEGLNDAYAALQWVEANAGEFGGRADIISVGGGSAGANLAAALTLKARDESGPSIMFQLLEVPALDGTLQSESMHRNSSGYDLDRRAIEILLPLYLPHPEIDVLDPYVSPLLARDLSGLPPAHIMSSEFDPLCDDGQRYATRLNEAGVPATFTLGLGHMHGSSAFTKVMPSARAWRDEAVETLRQAHATARLGTGASH